MGTITIATAITLNLLDPKYIKGSKNRVIAVASSLEEEEEAKGSISEAKNPVYSYY